MEKTLVRQATIVDFNSPFNGQKKDVLFANGQILNIADHIDETADLILEWKNAYLSNGWIDMQANFCDPGFEQKETLLSGLQAAANGGFTSVCPSPSTSPAISNKTQIEYLSTKSKSFATRLPRILPIGTITHKGDGQEISEMYDMMQAGAIAFSDYKTPIKDANLLQRVLLYAKNIEATTMVHCNDQALAQGGLMHEGEVSTRIGVKGMPAIAEEIDLERCISILQYTDGKLHINTISTAASVELIRKAKANGLRITCGVSIANLVFTESDLLDFKSFYKVNPPLRSVEDQIALKQGLLDGTIDVIVSDHFPHEIEAKDVEFDYAEFGMSTIETFFPMVLASKINLPVDVLIQKLYVRPSEILGLVLNTINIGSAVSATLFSLEATWLYNSDTRKSKGVNSAYLDRELFGKAIAIV
jgi:dihydroorotase